MIEEFAKSLSLTIWDWMAVLVALLSFLVASFSLIVAFKTLKSQRQTEINTLPVINLEIQEFLLCQLALALLDSHIRTTASWKLTNEKKYLFYLSEKILYQLKLPADLIHVELFYNNYEHYKTIQGLVNMINNYNQSIDVLIEHLRNKKIDTDVIYFEFLYQLKNNDLLVSTWSKVMTILFGYDDEMKSHLFEGFIIEIPNTEIAELQLSYYKDKEEYSEFFLDESNKKKMLLFMEKKTKFLHDEFIKFLIKR